MVMHARKQPRLDDGYMDKRDTHLFQSSQYPSKSYGNDSYGDRYRRDGSSSDRYRDESDRYRDNSSPSRHSPRYHNKSSYSEKPKNQYDKGSSGSSDKKVNHSYSNQRSNSQNGSYDKGVKSNSRDKDRDNSKSEGQKPPIRSSGDWSEHISSSGMRYYYNCKTEVSQWEKPKDWSDGSGSKVDSKPNDYRGNKSSLSSSQLSSIKSLDKSKHSSSGSDRTLSEKNLKRSLSDINYPHSGKPDKRYLIEKFQESQKQFKLDLAAERASQSSYTHYRTPMEHSKSDMSGLRKDGYSDQHASGSGSRRHRRDSEGNRSHSGSYVTPRKHNNDSQPDDNMDISPGSTPTSSRPSSCANTPQLGPASTPASIPTPSPVAIVTTATSTSSAPLISSIPQLITQLSGGQNNQELTHKATVASTSSFCTELCFSGSTSPRTTELGHRALQTLQKLQEVITRQIAQQTGPTPGNQPQQSPRPPTCDSQPLHSHPQPHPHPHSHSQPTSHPQALPGHNCINTLSSPHPVVHQPPLHVNTGPHHHHSAPGPGSVYGRLNQVSLQEDESLLQQMTGGDSPVSEASHGLSCASPGSSTTSSQNAAVGATALTATGIHQESSMGMPPALSNYYNENLISHVKGWQAEHAEKQANKYWQENLNVDSLRCSQVSVELKRARSLVRIAEIQSTLHEQRILFLAQQVHELESMKPPMFSSSHSFSTTSSSQ